MKSRTPLTYYDLAWYTRKHKPKYPRVESEFIYKGALESDDLYMAFPIPGRPGWYIWNTGSPNGPK